MKVSRVVAGVLAASGAVHAAVAWMAPPFWPGYLVWLGWIAIAAGSTGLSKRWFWITSALWNAGMLWLFLSDTDWTSANKAFVYWHSRAHLAIATLASTYLSFGDLPPGLKREPSRREHQDCEFGRGVWPGK